MTASVTEYHFFFLSHEADHFKSSPDKTAVLPPDGLRALIGALYKERLQILTLCILRPDLSRQASLSCHELRTGLDRAWPGSWWQALAAPAGLISLARPVWHTRSHWSPLQQCTIQTGVNDSTRVVIRTERSAHEADEVLIHGTLNRFPGHGLIASSTGRRWSRLVESVLPGNQASDTVQLFAGSNIYVELMHAKTNVTCLQPFLVIRTTAAPTTN